MTPIETITAIWLAASSSVALFAMRRTRPVDESIAAATAGVRVCIVRPCAGAEPGLARALASTHSFASATSFSSRGARLSIRFAVATVEDPATLVAADAIEKHFRGIDAKVVITGAVGPNAKADQLGRVLAEESCDVIVIADSDVDLEGINLDAFIAPLFRPEGEDDNIAAVWSAPIEIVTSTLADRASAALLDSSMHAFALLGELDPGCLVGKLVALRARDLEVVGGFSDLRDHLGEDMELARRFHAVGKRIVRSPFPARSLAQGRSIAAVVKRYARWLTVIRAQRPHLLATYPLLIAPTPLFCLLLPFVGEPSVLFFALALMSRFAIALGARERSQAASRARSFGAFAADVVLSDLLLWAAFVTALVSTRVAWRGRALRIARGGLLVHGVEEEGGR